MFQRVIEDRPHALGDGLVLQMDALDAAVDGAVMLGGAVYVLSAGMSLAAGLIADRWMRRGGGSNTVRKSMIGVASVVAIVCMLMCALGSPQIAIAGLLLSSISNGLGSFNMYAIAQTLAGPLAAGKWVGVQNCLGNVSGIVAPILTGAIIDATGKFQLAFLAAAGVAAVGLLCWMVVIRRIEPIDWSQEETGL